MHTGLKYSIPGIYFLLVFMICPAAAEAENSDSTLLNIQCDRDGVTIYLDGISIGATPVSEPVTVDPGYHFVSFFNHEMNRPDLGIRSSELIAELAEAGTRGFLANPGDTLTILMNWGLIEAKAGAWKKSIRRGRITVGTMIFIISAVGIGMAASG